MLSIGKIKRYKKIFFLFETALILILAVFLIDWRINSAEKPFIFNAKDVPKSQTAIILGAKVYSSGALSGMLEDRAVTAIDLYKKRKVEKILVSGDHSTENYDEVNAVKKYLLKNGIREEDIFLDYAGFDTYDSLYRAKEIFQVSSIVIVTQNFHLPRALYIARSIGIESYGVSADLHTYSGIKNNEIREIPAKIKAVFDISFGAKPKFLGESIPITGNGKKSWD